MFFALILLKLFKLLFIVIIFDIIKLSLYLVFIFIFHPTDFYIKYLVLHFLFSIYSFLFINILIGDFNYEDLSWEFVNYYNKYYYYLLICYKYSLNSMSELFSIHETESLNLYLFEGSLSNEEQLNKNQFVENCYMELAFKKVVAGYNKGVFSLPSRKDVRIYYIEQMNLQIFQNYLGFPDLKNSSDLNESLNRLQSRDFFKQNGRLHYLSDLDLNEKSEFDKLMHSSCNQNLRNAIYSLNDVQIKIIAKHFLQNGSEIKMYNRLFNDVEKFKNTEEYKEFYNFLFYDDKHPCFFKKLDENLTAVRVVTHGYENKRYKDKIKHFFLPSLYNNEENTNRSSILRSLIWVDNLISIRDSNESDSENIETFFKNDKVITKENLENDSSILVDRILFEFMKKKLESSK